MAKTDILKITKDKLPHAGLSREKRKHVGVLTMNGPFVAQHKDEIINLIRQWVNGFEQESHRAPPFRITERPASPIKVTFVKAHLARDIGRSLQMKYMGELDIRPEDGGESFRVTWWR
jgi:hypothetical protein